MPFSFLAPVFMCCHRYLPIFTIGHNLVKYFSSSNDSKLYLSYAQTGSAKANGREPKSCLGRVFNFMLGCFVMCTIAWPIQVRPSLKWKTRPRFCPVSLSLSMAQIIFPAGSTSQGVLIRMLQWPDDPGSRSVAFIIKIF
jgi:hypothetical protein